MKIKCPKCDERSNIITSTEEEEIIVRGEPIVVTVKTLHCESCGEEFLDPNEDVDPLELAYHEYRRKHSLVFPRQIKEMRSNYGLTQQELSDLLGWGGATISRYENGALQDLAHDKMLHLLQEPRNLLKLIEENPTVLPDAKLEELKRTINKKSNETQGDIKDWLDELSGPYEPDDLSGNRELNAEKIHNSILFFASGDGVLKTKLNKLLYYADFLHFKEYSVSITGARYVHLPYGPILDNYEFFIASMVHGVESIRIEEREFGEHLGEVLVSNTSPDIGIFEDSEIKVMAQVKEHFATYSASEISRKSHNERGYVETDDLEFISYEYASDIELEKEGNFNG